MNEAVKLIVIAIGMAIIDLPWLLIQGPAVQDIIRDIQADRSMNVRLWGAIPVYAALAYLVTQATSAPRAFLLGMCTYAVYDFTQIVTFDKYPPWFAIADTLWGGVLMALTWWIAERMGLVNPQR
jgi:uncharacterized membrane protein